MEQLSESREDREAPEDMETLEVHKRYFHICNGAKVTKSFICALVPRLAIKSSMSWIL